MHGVGGWPLRTFVALSPPANVRDYERGSQRQFRPRALLVVTGWIIERRDEHY
jgi:hypothetical protein